MIVEGQSIRFILYSKVDCNFSYIYNKVFYKILLFLFVFVFYYCVIDYEYTKNSRPEAPIKPGLARRAKVCPNLF